MHVSTRFCIAAAFSAALLFSAASAEEEAFKPELPLLEVKLVEKKTRIQKPGEDKAIEKKDMNRLLKQLSAHTDAENGWKGPDRTGISQNPVVVQVDALADHDEVMRVIGAGANNLLYRFVVGIREHTEKALSGAKAPDLEKLETGCLLIELPVDVGIGRVPPKPKDAVVLKLDWDEKKKEGRFSVALGDGVEKLITGAVISAADLASKNAIKRDTVREQIKKALLDYVKQGGDNIDRFLLKATDEDGEAGAPWAMFDLAYRACLDVNEDRVNNKEEKLDIRLPATEAMAEPPPPVPPSEKPVEYPKD
jgi:hypothetical protein